MAEANQRSDAVGETAIEFDPAALASGALARMSQAAEEVMEIHRVLAKTGDNVVGELLKNAGTFYEWNHYPDGDVYDAETGSQFYYHAHPADARLGEHGHFHTFLRPVGMTAEMIPVAVADLKPPADSNDALSHIVGISMNAVGFPVGLFTTNRWVTGETWYAARDVIAMIDRFEISHTQPSWPANRWITAILRLFRPQVAALIAARDNAVADWRRRHAVDLVTAFEDRDLEVTSYCRIDIADQVRAVIAAEERLSGAVSTSGT